MKKLLSIVFILGLIIYIACTLDTPKHTFKEIEYIVSNGETLWSIAEEYCPEDMDIRKYIHKLNTSPNIYEGQTIVILEEVK